MPPSPPLSPCNFLFATVQFSNRFFSHPFILPLFKTREGGLKKKEVKNASPPVKNTGVSGYSEWDCWEKGAAVFVRCRVGESVWILDTCLWEVHGVRAHFKLTYKQRGETASHATKRDTGFTSRLLCKLLTGRTFGPDAKRSLFICLCTSSVHLKKTYRVHNSSHNIRCLP